MKSLLIVTIATISMMFFPLAPTHPHESGPSILITQYKSQAKLQDTSLAVIEAVSMPAPPKVVVTSPPTPKPIVVASPAVTGCGDNFYANFIYMHESGCRLAAINPIGACGLGQALPCSKMGCSLSDYACENTWFTNYANSKYGGWAGAYAYWIGHSFW